MAARTARAVMEMSPCHHDPRLADRLRATLATLCCWLGPAARRCSSPRAAGPDPTPAVWTAPAAAGVATDLSGWWTRFGDPALAPLVAQALQANTNVDAAQARLRQARAQRTLAEAGLAPRVTGSGSAQASTIEGRAPSEQYRVGLDASWELDLWGAGAAGVRAAEASARPAH